MYIYIYIYGVVKVNPQALGGLRINRIADYEKTLCSVSGCREAVRPSVCLNLANQEQKHLGKVPATQISCPRMTLFW